jgi:uncharacterized repeat protein (TIGR03806 family)
LQLLRSRLRPHAQILRVLLPALTFMALWLPACEDDDPQAPPPAKRVIDELPPLNPRPQTQSCRVEGTLAEAMPRVTAELAFANVSFDEPTQMVPDGSGLLLVAERSGTIRSLADDPATNSTDMWFDLRSRIAPGGMLSFALAPDYGTSGDLFVYFIETEQPFRTTVVRFSLGMDGKPDISSERRVIDLDHPTPDHPGGGLSFGADGMLYISVGDGGEQYDPDGHAQSTEDLLGSVLRIDISTLDNGNYTIPSDNPLSGAGERREIWAWGMSNPNRCAFDGDTLWCSDQNQRLGEVLLVSPGDNHGWPELEGSSCVGGIGSCNPANFSAPLDIQRTGEDECGMLGGMVLHDMTEPLLDGVYIYGDSCSGRIWGARATPPEAPVFSRMGRVPAPLTGFGSDGDGNVYALAAGQIVSFSVAEGGVPGSFPTKLSETGCFTDLSSEQPAPDMVPFVPNAALWTDGVHKMRYFAIPPDSYIELTDSGAWTWPEGTVLTKNFIVEREEGSVASRSPVETRFMVLRDGDWEFHTYRWNDQANEAELLDDDLTVEFSVVRQGATQTMEYLYPDRFGCQTCHGLGRGNALGPRTDQLNRVVSYGGELKNQLEAMAEIGLFAEPLSVPAAQQPVIADPGDPEAPLELRARAYLHGNCGHCHRPGGWVPLDLDIDFRYETALRDSNTCGVEAKYYAFATVSTVRIDPGAPDNSLVLERLSANDYSRMPPIGTFSPDPQGVAVVRAWISSLTGCP